MKIQLAALVLVLSYAGTAQGVVIWDESVDGDLSGDFTTPTTIRLALGVNTIVGQIGSNGNSGATDGSDGDFFFLSGTLQQGTKSASIESFAVTSDQRPGFIASEDGFGFPGQGLGDVVSNFQLFNVNAGPENIRGVFGLFGQQNTYGLQIPSPTDASSPFPVAVDYTITILVTPEPSTTAMLLTGLVCLMPRRRR